MQIFDTWLKGFVEGLIVFPIAYYVIKNFGGVLLTDVTALIKKATGPKPPVPPVVPVV